MGEKKLSEKIPIDELKRRADSGDVDAQSALGLLYELGLDVPAADKEEAAKWFGKAAKAGDKVAQFSLAEIISKDFDETDENRAMAQALYKKAEEGGLVREDKALRVLSKDSGKAWQVLIVDDSATIRVGMRAFLEAEGCVVTEAEDGQHGVDILRKNSDFTMIYCDVNMPRLNGFDFLKSVRAGSATAKIPVVIMTTENSPEMVGRGKSLGVNGWIVKPPRPHLVRKYLNKFTRT